MYLSKYIISIFIVLILLLIFFDFKSSIIIFCLFLILYESFLAEYINVELTNTDLQTIRIDTVPISTYFHLKQIVPPKHIISPFPVVPIYSISPYHINNIPNVDYWNFS